MTLLLALWFLVEILIRFLYGNSSHNTSNFRFTCPKNQVKLDKAPQPASVLRLVTSNMENQDLVTWLLSSQPIWKICSSNWKSSSKWGVKMKKKSFETLEVAGFPKCSAFKFEESIANFHGQEDQKISCPAFPSGRNAFYREIFSWKSPLTRKKRRQKHSTRHILTLWPWFFYLKATPPGMKECHLKRDHSKSKIVFQPSFFRGYVSFQGSITFQLWMTWWNSSPIMARKALHMPRIPL